MELDESANARLKKATGYILLTTDGKNFSQMFNGVELTFALYMLEKTKLDLLNCDRENSISKLIEKEE